MARQSQFPGCAPDVEGVTRLQLVAQHWQDAGSCHSTDVLQMGTGKARDRPACHPLNGLSTKQSSFWCSCRGLHRKCAYACQVVAVHTEAVHACSSQKVYGTRWAISRRSLRPHLIFVAHQLHQPWRHAMIQNSLQHSTRS